MLLLADLDVFRIHQELGSRKMVVTNITSAVPLTWILNLSVLAICWALAVCHATWPWCIFLYTYVVYQHNTIFLPADATSRPQFVSCLFVFQTWIKSERRGISQGGSIVQTAFILHTYIKPIFKSCCLISFCILGSFEPACIQSVACLTATPVASSRGTCSLLTPFLHWHQSLSRYHETDSFPKRLERILLEGSLPADCKWKKERKKGEDVCCVGAQHRCSKSVLWRQAICEPQ